MAQVDFSRIRIVLVELSHSGNLGAVARVMKNMGLSQLVLVSPKADIDGRAIAMASGADDLLQSAQVVDSLEEAIAPCEFVFATSARARRLNWPQLSARACAEKIATLPDSPVAIVFGCERSGLSNEQLSLCHYRVYIPTVPDFSSLNLSQAVLVLCYELMAYYGEGLADCEAIPCSDGTRFATREEVQGLHEHFFKVMAAIDFLHPNQSETLGQRLARFFAKSQLSVTELNILRGFLSTVEKKLKIQ